MITEQQYRVIGKSGPGVDWRSLPGDTMIRFVYPSAAKDPARLLGASAPMQDWWDNARYEILEAISPPQAAVAECADWCGLGYADYLVPAGLGTHFFACAGPIKCTDMRCKHLSYCTQACLDRAKAAKAPAHSPVMTHGERAALLTRCPVHGGGNCGATCAGRGKAPECIRSACKAPPVAGGELCAAHAGQVEAVKAKCCAWKNGVSACGRPSVGGRLCTKHEAELRASDAKPSPPPTETRLERWRREHKGYSHGTADPRIHDANVAAMMMGIDGPREAYVPPPKLPPWTPRDLDGDIPNAWEPGGARLGGTR